MIEYNSIKDSIITYDPVLGEISLDFILDAIQNLVKQEKHFEDIVNNILNHSEMDEQDIASLFNLSTLDLIEMYLKMIKDEL